MTKKAAILGSVMIVLAAASTVRAGTKLEVYGIQVKMNTPGDAYFDDAAVGGDNTVTIVPWYDFAKIKISTARDAPVWWGGYCDIFILADGMIVDQIKTKGSDETYLYLVGQTYHCDQFKGDLTFIGNTDAYGLDVGLGMTSASETGWPWPKKVMLKSGVCYAALLANDYFNSAKSVDEKLSSEARAMLFDK